MQLFALLCAPNSKYAIVVLTCLGQFEEACLEKYAPVYPALLQYIHPGILHAISSVSLALVQTSRPDLFRLLGISS